MQYRKDRNGVQLSALGFGCMRFSRSAGSIDLAKAEKQILAAYEAGVNYYDTAYIYPGSEVALPAKPIFATSINVSASRVPSSLKNTERQLSGLAA